MSRPLKNYDQDLIDRICDLRRSGMSYVNIGKETKTSHQTAKTICEKNNIEHIDHRYGENNVNWTGGARIIDTNGYVNIYVSQDHPFYEAMKTRRHMIMEHRLIMAESIGRPLFKHETVHHKNGNRQDNRIENLELWSKMQPPGQSVSDKIEYAIEILSLYRPELLKEE